LGKKQQEAYEEIERQAAEQVREISKLSEAFAEKEENLTAEPVEAEPAKQSSRQFFDYDYESLIEDLGNGRYKVRCPPDTESGGESYILDFSVREIGREAGSVFGCDFNEHEGFWLFLYEKDLNQFDKFSKELGFKTNIIRLSKYPIWVLEHTK
jgi:hypothetical protein